MTLRSEEGITKILLSTTSYLVGQYEEENFLLSIAINRDLKRYDILDHEYFISAVRVPPHDKSCDPFPDYSGRGDILSIYLSILYGKRFDNHGVVESSGMFWLPNYSPFGNYNPNLPFNSRKPRPDLEIPLVLDEFKRIFPLLNEEQVNSRFRHFIRSAGRFYVHALKHIEPQPEIAFLDLITCGEILSNFFEYNQDDLLDGQIKRDLTHIEETIDDGDKIVRRIRSELFKVKGRFTKTILNLLNPYFFQQSEANESWGSLKKSDILIRIKAAYDLRSRYVHTGESFGWWVAPWSAYNNEIPFGEPIIADKEFKKILVRSPTLIGMERIMRFCLLRFIHLYGTPVDHRLDGDGLTDGKTDTIEE
jgi:hypothetical protein